MHALIEKLAAERPVLTDGAIGSALASYAANGVSAAEANLVFPEDVFLAHTMYHLEGSRILLANTFQAGRTALSRLTACDVVNEVNTSAVILARDAAGEEGLVFGSIGPSGDATAAESAASVTEQAGILAEAGVDGFVIETMTHIGEAVAAVRACRATCLPVVACMAFLPGGADPLEAASALEDAGADALGANCTAPDEMLVACRLLRGATGLPLWMKPNAGLPCIENGLPRWPLSPDDFTAGALALVDEGADFIGGCCGAHWRHIRALSLSLGRWRD